MVVKSIAYLRRVVLTLVGAPKRCYLITRRRRALAIGGCIALIHLQAADIDIQAQKFSHAWGNKQRQTRFISNRHRNYEYNRKAESKGS